MENNPKLSIITVNWNCGESIIDCISAVVETVKNTSYEVIVVDNNSTDGSLEKIITKWPNVRILKNPGNYMFARANNQGYAISQGDYIFILNPDTIVTAGAVDRLVEVMESGQEDVVTSKLLNLDGSVQYGMHRGFPSLSRLVLSFFYRSFSIFSILPQVKNYLLLDNKFNTDFYVEQAAGAAILIKRSLIKELGYLFDEGRFPLLYNDVDLTYRIYKHGGRILCKTDISIIHARSQSLNKINQYKRWQMHIDAFILFCEKNKLRGNYIGAIVLRYLVGLFV